MRPAAETLYIGRIGRGGAGLLGVGPGFLIRRLAGRFIERTDALTCLGHVRAGAEVLQICRIGCGGAGLLGVGPGLLVRLLARLLIGRLLLRRLLRIRGLAASRREGSPGNDGNHRQFRKCDASRARGLLTPIISHGWPFQVCAAPPPAWPGFSGSTKFPAHRLFPRPPQLWRPKCWGWHTANFWRPFCASFEEPTGKDFAEIALI